MSLLGDVTDLQLLADDLLTRAANVHARRAARTLPHPVEGLRQTVLALMAGAELGEHESPGPASLVVLRGRIRLVAGDDVIEVGPHQFTPLPDRRHGLHADEDSIVLLSIAVPDRMPMMD
jgi:quercetin dioxygenase-like cupin family protein